MPPLYEAGPHAGIGQHTPYISFIDGFVSTVLALQRPEGQFLSVADRVPTYGRRLVEAQQTMSCWSWFQEVWAHLRFMRGLSGRNL